MNDETLKEQIKDILRMPHNKKPERFSIATQIRNEQLGLIMDLVKQDRERAVKELLEHLMTSAPEWTYDAAKDILMGLQEKEQQ